MGDQPTAADDTKPKVATADTPVVAETEEVTAPTPLIQTVFKPGDPVKLNATVTDTSGVQPMELTDKSAPQLDKPALEQKAKELNAAINRGGWFFGLNESPDKEAINRLLSPLNKADRAALEKVYAEKYPDSKDGLRGDLKKILGGDNSVEWRKVEAILNRDDNRTNDAGNVMTALTHMSTDSRAGNAELRAAISTLNSRQIAQMREDYQKQYGVSLDDALKNNENINPQTRDALGILLKGSDKRTADDQIAMANLALATNDRRLFAEALRGDGPAATEARERLRGDEGFKTRMRNAFPSDLAMDPEVAPYVTLTNEEATEQVAQDYLNEGRISLKTIAEGNTGKWIFDNKDNVELAARNASDSERRDFILGRELATSIPIRQPANDQEKAALAHYNKIHDAFTRTGNARDVAIWEDNLIHGRPTVVTEMARTHKDGHVFGLFGSGHSRQEVIAAAENLSKQDYDLLRSDKGDAYLKQIEQSMGYADPGERTRVMELLKAKREAPTYEQSQQVHRTIQETIADNTKSGVFSDSYNGKNILQNVARMSPEEAAAYKADPAALDKFVNDNLRGLEQAYAKRLLEQVKQTGLPPKEGPVERMFSLSLYNGKSEDILKAAEQAFREDPTLRDRMSKPWDDQPVEDKMVRIVMEIAISKAVGEDQSENSYFTTRIMDSFMKNGRFTAEQQLHLGYPLKDVIPTIAAAPPEERDAAMKRLEFRPELKQVVEAIMNNPDQKPTLADRMRLFTAGAGGNYSDFKDELQSLSYEQRQQLKEEFQRKYGKDLDNDFLNKVDDKDKGVYKDLLTPTGVDGRQRFFDNYMQLIKSDSGLSADYSQGTLERASDQNAGALEEYQRIYKTLPLEKQQALDAFFNESLKQYKDSKGKLGEVIVDATITAAALAAAPFTAGMSTAALATLVAGAAATGAAYRVAMMKGIQGNDYDDSKLLADLVKGGATAALNFLTLGAGGAVAGKVGTSVVGRIGTAFGDDVVGVAGKTLLQTELPALVTKYGAQIPEQELAALVAKAAAEGASPAQRAALQAALRDGVSTTFNAEMRSLIELAKQSGRSAAEGGLANAGGEVAYAMVDPKYDFSNFALSTGIGILVGGLVPIGLRGLKSGKDAIVNFRAAPEHVPGGGSHLEIHPADQSGPITVRHADGSTTTLKPGEAVPPYKMKPGDQIIDAPEMAAARTSGGDSQVRAPGGTRAWQNDAVVNPWAPNKDYSLRIGDQNIPVSQQRIGLGRQSDNAIVGNHPDVSRHHADIQFTDRGPVLSDLNSSNGTYINGRRMNANEQVVLKPGDKVRLSANGPEYTWGEAFRPDAFRGHALEWMGQQHSIPKDKVIIGRDPNADITFGSSGVSRQHAELRFDADGAHIRDLNSTNGTFVNGKRLKPGEEVALKPGDRVQLGNDTEFRFRERQPAVDVNAPRTIREYDPRNSGGDNAARPEAVRQSNQYSERRELWEPMEDGWQRVSRGAEVRGDGSFNSPFPSTVVDRTKDTVLNQTVTEAMQRYRRLAEDAAALSKTNPALAATKYQELARELAEFSKTKMHPRGWTEDMVDNAYNSFYAANGGKRILLGDYIEQAARGQGAGVCSQQAILFKVLVDEFNAKIPGFEMRAGLIHGNYGDVIRPGQSPNMNHAWNEVEINGRRYVYDPRQQHYGNTYEQLPDHHPGRDFVTGGPQPQVADQNFDLRQKLKAESSVQYDGRQWRVKSVDADGAVITQDAIRGTSAAEFMAANPGKKLELGQRYAVVRSSGQREEGWMFQGYNNDGSLRFYKENAIETRVSRRDLLIDNPALGGVGEMAAPKVTAADIAGATGGYDVASLTNRIHANGQTDLIPALRDKILDRMDKYPSPAELQAFRQSADLLGFADAPFKAKMKDVALQRLSIAKPQDVPQFAEIARAMGADEKVLDTAVRQRLDQLFKEGKMLTIDRGSGESWVEGYPTAYMRARQQAPGVVTLEHVMSGALPPGYGSVMMADALKAHGTIPTKQFTIKGIHNLETISDAGKGVAAADSKLGRTGVAALERLGLHPKSVRYERAPNGSLSLVFEM